MKEWIEWIAPFGPNNEPVYMRVEPAVAIIVQRQSAEVKSGYKYLTDQDAINDFMAVRWAYHVSGDLK